MEDRRAEVTPKTLGESTWSIWEAVMIGIVSVILWWLLRAFEEWRSRPRIPEENLQKSGEIPESIPEEKIPGCPGKISEDNPQQSCCKISDEKTHASPCSSRMETFKEKVWDNQSRISQQLSWNKPRRIVKEIVKAAPEPFGAKPLAKLPLQKRCERCRLSSVVLEANLSIKGRRFRRAADGPAYYLDCVIGDTNRDMKSLIDTGCTRSAIDLEVVRKLGLLDQVDQSRRIHYEAMGGERRFTYGLLYAPLRTLSGFLLIEELMVVEMGMRTLIIGLDVLAVNNCSLLLDVHRPILMLRERGACSTFIREFDLRGSADVVAKINGVLHKSTLDTGTFRTVVPKSLDLAQDPLSECAYLNVAVKDPLRVSKKVTSLELEVNECVGRVDPFVMPETHPLIGTDFLQGKRIDFIHGKVYVESLGFKRDCGL